MTDKSQREAFEAWAKDEGFDLTNFRGDFAWAAWQAAQSQSTTQERIERKIYKDTPEYNEYLSARFPANKAMGNSFEWQGHRWTYHFTAFGGSGDYDCICRIEDSQLAPTDQWEAMQSAYDFIERLRAYTTIDEYASAERLMTALRQALTAPPAPARLPLDGALIRDLWAKTEACDNHSASYNFARAIEAAHGIGPEQEGGV